MATKIENDEVIPDEELNEIIEKINEEEDRRIKIIVDEYQQLASNGFFVLDTETTDLVNIINREENKNKTIFIYNDGFDLSTIYRSFFKKENEYFSR